MQALLCMLDLLVIFMSCLIIIGCSHPQSQETRVVSEPSEAPLCERLHSTAFPAMYAQKLPEQRQQLATIRQTPLPTDYRERIEAAFVAILKDPDSRRLSSIFTPSGSVVCGMVNARNSFGGYTGPQPFMGYFDMQGRVSFLQSYSFQELVNLRSGPAHITVDTCGKKFFPTPLHVI